MSMEHEQQYGQTETCDSETNPTPEQDLFDDSDLRAEAMDRYGVDEHDFENITGCYDRDEAISRALHIVDSPERAAELVDSLRAIHEFMIAQDQFAGAVWSAQTKWADRYEYTNPETGARDPIGDPDVINDSLFHSSESNPVASYVRAQQEFRDLVRATAIADNELLGVAMMDLVDVVHQDALGSEPYPDEMPEELSRQHFALW